MAQSVNTLTIHCQGIGAAEVVGSSPIGEAVRVDCLFTPSNFKNSVYFLHTSSQKKQILGHNTMQNRSYFYKIPDEEL